MTWKGNYRIQGQGQTQNLLFIGINFTMASHLYSCYHLSRVLWVSQNFEFYKGEWLASCHKREEKTDTVRYYTLYNKYDM